MDLSSTSSFETSGRQLVQSKGEDGFAEDEYNFNSEIQLLTKSYIWQDKYKPRKPRFFNRVHTVSIIIIIIIIIIFCNLHCIRII